MASDLKAALDGLRLDRGGNEGPRRRRWGRWLALAAVLVAMAVVLLAGGGTRVTTAAATAIALPPGSPPVPVLNASGYVVARRQATVSSKITGRVAEVLIEEGVKVEQGEVLARLDDAEAVRALALAEAQLGAARKALDESSVRLAEARLRQQRTRELAAGQIRSQADVDAVDAEVGSFAAQLAVGREQVVVAERVLAVERQNLENTVIRAPFSGVAISKNAQPGEMISPVSAGGGFTRTGITTVVDMASLEIEVEVNENYIERVRPGQRVEARLNAYPDRVLPAAVITTIPAADRESATVLVRIAFDALDPRILPEMGVKVAFLADPAEAGEAGKRVVVPESALRREDETDLVFVVRDGKAVRRTVEIAVRRDGSAELVSGVAAGEEVVVDGPANLEDGQRVRSGQ